VDPENVFYRVNATLIKNPEYKLMKGYSWLSLLYAFFSTDCIRDLKDAVTLGWCVVAEHFLMSVLRNLRMGDHTLAGCWVASDAIFVALGLYLCGSYI
jgi:hypothetical protein